MRDTRVHNDCDGGQCYACYQDELALKDWVLDQLLDDDELELVRNIDKKLMMKTKDSRVKILNRLLDKYKH